MIFVRPLYRIDYRGKENIPKKGGLIVCCNHISFFDPLVLGFAFRRKIFFMAKSEFFTDCGFFVKAFMKLCGVFSVKREYSDTGALNKASVLLKNGNIVGIFPQGRIVSIKSVFEPKAGAALLSVKENVPVLPVSVFSQGKIRPFSKITVIIGKTIFPEFESPAKENSLKAARNLNKLIKKSINTQLEDFICQKK